MKEDNVCADTLTPPHNHQYATSVRSLAAMA